MRLGAFAQFETISSSIATKYLLLCYSLMQHFKLEDISNWERFFRANLINAITGYKTASLIGTVNEKGINNLGMFSSIIHLGADPALIGFIQRPITATSHTFKNILSTKYYTINQVSAHMLHKAHYTSAKFNAEQSEFELCNLTVQHVPNFVAPFVAESKVKIGVELVEVIPITHNNTQLVIGSLQHILLDEEIISTDGNLNLAGADTVVVAGLEQYYKVQPLVQLGYAKAEQLPEQWLDYGYNPKTKE